MNQFPTCSVLIVDDEQSMRRSIQITLKANGITNTICIGDSRNVMKLLAEKDVGIILLDLSMPYISGKELLEEIHFDYPDITVIMVTGNAKLSTAVECMKLGAADYLVKPIEKNKLIATVSRGVEIQELRRENRTLKKQLFTDKLENPEAFSEIITVNEKMKKIFQYIEIVSRTSQTILITGETGVGKELITHAIHCISGRNGDLVSVNIAGFDDNLFSDTLFGHTKNAFTGAGERREGLLEKANSGTLFLDEIGDLSSPSQVKLLRLLESREYFPLGSDVPKLSNARLLVATNRNLIEDVDKGLFRKDLFYRLSSHTVQIPPLRERKEDLPLLIDHFLDRATCELNKKRPTPPPELYILLETYSFPGNIRELRSIIYDAVSRHKSGKLSLSVFRDAIDQEPMPIENHHADVSFSDTIPTFKEMDRILIREAMRRARGKQSIASKMLGITHQALSKRLKNIDPQEYS